MSFEWIDACDSSQSVITFLRKCEDETLLVLCNFTPVVRHNYRVGVPHAGTWKMLLNSDEERFGGSGVGGTEVKSEKIAQHGRPFSIEITLPPLGINIFKKDIV